MSERSFTPPSATRTLDLSVRAPGSKSITNRALICAALADGRSELGGVAPGDDTDAMISGLGALGVDIVGADGDDGDDGGHPWSVRVSGQRGRITAPTAPVECALAGTTSRFLSAVAGLGSSAVVIDGAERLRHRPMQPLFAALRSLGATVVGDGGDDRLPVTISGPLRGGSVRLPGDVSSQFISALMMVGPSLDGGLEIILQSAVVSRPYVEMTASVMEHFGAQVSVSSDRIVVGAGGYRARDLEIEADASSASYPSALVALRGGRVTLEGVGSASLQGDRCFADVLAEMGCEVVWSERSVTIQRDDSVELRAVDIDLRDASDLVPSVAVVAATAQGTTRIDGVGFIRGKESDRIGDLVTELRRIGVAAVERPDGLEITGTGSLAVRETVLTHHDHRLAMAFAVLSSARHLSLSIADPGVVSKSWPGFWNELARWCTPGSTDRSGPEADDSASGGR